MHLRAGRGRRAVCNDGPAVGSRAVCTDGPVGAIGQYAPTGPAGDAVERYTPSGKLIGEGGSRAVCAIKTARQSGSMHRQAGWGCRAVCSDGRLGHLRVGRYAVLCTDGPGGAQAVGRCADGRRGAVGGMLRVASDGGSDGPGGAVGRSAPMSRRGAIGRYAPTGRVGLSGGSMH